MAYPSTPTELVEMRRGWISWAKSPFAKKWLEEAQFVDSSMRIAIELAVGLAKFRESLVDAVEQADLYVVTPEMQDFIEMAAEDVPPVNDLTPDDLPATCGLICWAGGPRDGSNIVADLWFPFLSGREDGESYDIILTGMFGNLSIGKPEGYKPTMFPLVTCVAFDPLPIGGLSGELLDRFYADPGRRRLITTLLLMQQKVGRIETEKTSRPAQRADKRANVVPRDVSVFYLPKVESQAATSESEHRGYSHRFLVRGFWRNQWYPSRQVSRPKYILPFIKGPADKPIVLKENVGIVRKPNNKQATE